MAEKKVTKEELVKMIRGMVKENLQKRAKNAKMLEESKNTKKISIKELQEMVKKSIEEVISEEVQKKKTK